MKTFLYPIIFIAVAVSACTHTFDVRLKASTARYKDLAETEQTRVDYLREKNNERRSQNRMPSGIEIKNVNANSFMANHFLIKNNTNNDIFVEYEKSSMQFKGRSYRVVAGETRKKDTAMAIPDRIIAAGTYSEVSFYLEDENENSALFDKLNISI